MTDSMGDRAERTVARSRSRKGTRQANGTVPVLRRIFPAPVAAKVPEVIALFWVVKILTTAGGEATSDFLKNWGNIKGGGTEVLLFAVGLILQFWHAPLPGGRLLVPRLLHCHLRYWSLRFPPPRCEHPLCGHHGPVGSCTGPHLRGVAPDPGTLSDTEARTQRSEGPLRPRAPAL